MKTIFFNSSMPRSMSTLLQCILNQNPSICATPTDPVLEYLFAARKNYTHTPEAKAMGPELALKTWRGFCQGGLQGYAAAYTDRPNLCIKTRGATIHYRWFESFMPEKPKMICMVRDLRAILASMEKIFRNNAENHSDMVNHGEMKGTSTAKRVGMWLNSPPVGLALERLQQCYQEGINREMLILRAEDLTTNPADTMRRLYDYLGLESYAHDFDNVEQSVTEDDSVYGLTPDLHTIRNKVRPLKADFDEVLGSGICAQINQQHAWYQNLFGYLPQNPGAQKA
jgi:sulfotransferase